MPQYDPAIAQTDPVLVVGKVLELLRTGKASPEAKTWALSCSNSGRCIPACPEGVNPRKMLALARLELRRQQTASNPQAAQQAARVGTWEWDVKTGEQVAALVSTTDTRDWLVVSGRPISPEDVDGATKVALLGQTTVQNLFGGDIDPLGQIVRIKKVPFAVIGVLDRKGQNSWGQDQDDVILIPLSTAKKKVLGKSNSNPRAVQAISVKIRPGEDMSEAESQLRELLRQRHRLQPYQEDDFNVRNLSEILQTQVEATIVGGQVVYGS